MENENNEGQYGPLPDKRSRYPRTQHDCGNNFGFEESKAKKEKVATVNFKPVVSSIRHVTPENNPEFYTSSDSKPISTTGVLRRLINNYTGSPSTDYLYFGRITQTGFMTFKIKNSFARLFISGAEGLIKKAVKDESGIWTFPGHTTVSQLGDFATEKFWEHPDSLKNLIFRVGRIKLNGKILPFEFSKKFPSNISV